jgi:hypothetical protein
VKECGFSGAVWPEKRKDSVAEARPQTVAGLRPISGWQGPLQDMQAQTHDRL